MHSAWFAGEARAGNGDARFDEEGLVARRELGGDRVHAHGVTDTVDAVDVAERAHDSVGGAEELGDLVAQWAVPDVARVERLGQEPRAVAVLLTLLGEIDDRLVIVPRHAHRIES